MGSFLQDRHQEIVSKQSRYIAGFISDGSNLVDSFQSILINLVDNADIRLLSISTSYDSEYSAQVMLNGKPASVSIFERNKLRVEQDGEDLLVNSKSAVSLLNAECERFFAMYEHSTSVDVKSVKSAAIFDLSPIQAVAQGYVKCDLNIIADRLLLAADGEFATTHIDEIKNEYHKADPTLLTCDSMIASITHVLAYNYSSPFHVISKADTLRKAYNFLTEHMDSEATAKVEKGFTTELIESLDIIFPRKVDEQFLEHAESGKIEKEFYWPHITLEQLNGLTRTPDIVKDALITIKMSNVLCSSLDEISSGPEHQDIYKNEFELDNTFSL
jgi:hypothetical protein